MWRRGADAGKNRPMSNPATYDDANLILRLYELRREEKLRRAREWFAANCSFTTLDEAMKVMPPGSQENAYFRMVASYWDMAASLVTSGVLNEQLFLETNGEIMFVWERVRGLVQEFRDKMKHPTAWHNLEKMGEAAIKRLDASGPEALSTWRNMMRGMTAAARES